MADGNESKTIDMNDALETMRLRSGKSTDGLSKELGHYRTWYRNMRSREDMYLSSLLAVASITGHDVALLDHATGDVIALLAPPSDTSKSSNETS